MKKKFKHTLAVTLITAFVVLALGSASEPPPQPNTVQVGNSIIGYALVVRLAEQRGWTIGSFDNSGITVSRATVRERVARFVQADGDQEIRSDMVFTVSAQGILSMRFQNMQRFSFEGMWQDFNVPNPYLQAREFHDDIMLELAAMYHAIPHTTTMAGLLNDNVTPEVLNTFFGNFQYLAAFMGTLTQVGRTTFIELLIGRTYNWSWPMVSIAENRNPAFDRRFLVRFQRQNRNLGGTVTLNVFTNDASLQMIPLNQSVTFSGTLVSVEGNNIFNLLHE